MIADLKPYPEYKNSDIPWLDCIPSHWKQRRMKVLFRERKQKGFPDEPLLAATQTRGVIRKEDYGTRTVTASKDFHLLKLVDTGDFVISLRSFQGGIELAHCRGIISPAYTVLTPRPEINGKYYALVFKSMSFISSLTLFITGIREGQNIDYVRLSRADMPCPPAEEQVLIAKFLSNVIGRLDRRIRSKKKVIHLLAEQKSTIIQRAVTCGIDSLASLKPSNIVWLSHIPSHWEVRSIKQIVSRFDYGTSENVRTEGPILVLTMSHIRDGKITLPREGGLNAVPPGLLLEKHDLLFNRTNSPDLVGKVGIFSGKASDDVTFASYLVRMRVKSEYSPLWLNYLLNSLAFWGFARSQALVSLHQANLNPNRYGRMLIPVPLDRQEQDAIVNHIQVRGEEIERAISHLEQEVQCLKEYRTRLIEDVVTGKVDVRDAVISFEGESGQISSREDPALMMDEELEDEDAVA